MALIGASSPERIGSILTNVLRVPASKGNKMSFENYGFVGHESEEVTVTVNQRGIPETRTKGQALTSGKGRQLFAALAATIGAAALGTVLAWTATALPGLRKSDKFDIGEDGEIWIGPIALLGAVTSCPFAGVGIAKLGRRKVMLCLTTPFLVGYLLMAFAQNVFMIYAGRFITGFCGGAFSIAIPVFITEMADASIRGGLASGFDMMVTVGILYIFLIGTFVTWEVQAFACGALAILYHILLLFVPESPLFLTEKGRLDEARAALSWFRNVPEAQIEGEMNELIWSVDESKAKSTNWRDFLSVSVIKPTSIGLALMWFQQMCAVDPVMLFTVDIFHSAGTDIDENLSTNIIGAVQVVATITSALLVDHLGRRFLLLISEIFVVISLGALGLFFHLKEFDSQGQLITYLSWLPLVSLMVFVVAFSVGFGPIPWMLMGEMLPSHVKGVASGIVTSSRWILGFAVSLAFKDMIRVFTEGGAYWFFCALSFMGIFYVYFFVPETKGKTLDEIQLYFNKPSVNTRNSNCDSGISQDETKA